MSNGLGILAPTCLPSTGGPTGEDAGLFVATPATLGRVSLPCPHFATAMADLPPAANECPSCVEIGSTWVHLRQCLVCGRTGCCDNSPNRHATAHAQETGHALIQSAQPGEKWAWCYPDNAFFIPGEDGGWALFEE